MIKTEIVVKENFRDIYDLLIAKKDNLDLRFEEAKVQAILEVEASFSREKSDIDSAIALCTQTIEVEVPDETIVDEAPLI